MIEGLTGILHALAASWVDPASRTFLPALFAAAGIGGLGMWASTGSAREAWHQLRRGLFDGATWRHRSSRLDLQLWIVRQLLAALRLGTVAGGAFALGLAWVRVLDGAFGIPELSLAPGWASMLYTVALFVAWDGSRYALHRVMHAVPALWRLHAVHHSAEVLTPLTFHRIHPIESALYQVRGLLVTAFMAGSFYWLFRGHAAEVTILGVHSIGFVLNALTGNLRHSHVWLRFPRAVERWFLSPAQHQHHHSLRPEDQRTNYGTWLAVWDRWGGSLAHPDKAPDAFGLGADGHADLWDALWRPLRSKHRMPAAAMLAPCIVVLPARAEPPEDAVRFEDDDVLEVLVEEEGGVPRAAGSAHVITEETLEQHEYDDVHKALATVPGVALRDEDGFGLRPNIGIRGANSDRSAKLTLMEDGVLFGPAPYAAPAAYYFPMTTRLTGIEVFKGAAATRFGPQTIGGAINLRTREVPESSVASVDFGAGLRNTIKVHGFAGYGDGRWGLLLEGVHLGTAGFKDLDGGGPTGFERTELMLKTKWASDPDRHVRHSVELKGGYGRELSDETYLGLHTDDIAATLYRRYAASALDRMRWHRGQAEAAWLVRVGDDADVRTVAYYHHLTRAWRKLNRFAGGPDLHTLLSRPPGGQGAVFLDILRGDQDSATADQRLQIGTNDRTFHSMGLQSTAHWRATSGIVASQLEVGVRLHGDIVDRRHTEEAHDMRAGTLRRTDDDVLTLLDARTTALAFAAHVHEDLGIGPVRLLPSARLEVIQTGYDDADADPQDPVTRATFLPGFAVHGAATWWLDVFGGVHRGFSPVAPGQAAEVQPETAWNYELGLRAHERGFRAEAVGFLSDYANITGQCTVSGGCDVTAVDQQFNGGAAWVYGVEGLVGHTFGFGGDLALELEGTYAYTGSQFRTAFRSAFPQYGQVNQGDALPYVPEHQGAGRVVLTHPRFSLSASVQGRSALRDVAGQGVLPEEAAIPAMAVVDLAARVHIHELVSAYASVTNLGGSTAVSSWRPFGARPIAPLQVMLGVRVTYDRASSTRAPARTP